MISFIIQKQQKHDFAASNFEVREWKWKGNGMKREAKLKIQAEQKVYREQRTTQILTGKFRFPFGVANKSDIIHYVNLSLIHKISFFIVRTRTRQILRLILFVQIKCLITLLTSKAESNGGARKNLLMWVSCDFIRWFWTLLPERFSCDAFRSLNGTLTRTPNRSVRIKIRAVSTIDGTLVFPERNRTKTSELIWLISTSRLLNGESPSFVATQPKSLVFRLICWLAVLSTGLVYSVNHVIKL